MTSHARPHLPDPICHPVTSGVCGFCQFMSQSRGLPKIDNIKHMLKTCEVVALSETHIDDALTAEMLFFKHIPRTVRFLRAGMAFVLQEDWATERNITEEDVDNIVQLISFQV